MEALCFFSLDLELLSTVHFRSALSPSINMLCLLLFFRSVNAANLLGDYYSGTPPDESMKVEWERLKAEVPIILSFSLSFSPPTSTSHDTKRNCCISLV